MYRVGDLARAGSSAARHAVEPIGIGGGGEAKEACFDGSPLLVSEVVANAIKFVLNPCG